MSHIRAPQLLRENISGLLHKRHLSQADLAFSVPGRAGKRRDKSWMNKFLSSKRGIRIDDLDAIADVLGVETYQLFQPGIASMTERRSGRDRRSGRERRIGAKGRAAVRLDAEMQAAHPRRQQEEIFALTGTERHLIERMRQVKPHVVETILGVFDAAAAGTEPVAPPQPTSKRAKTKA